MKGSRCLPVMFKVARIRPEHEARVVQEILSAASPVIWRCFGLVLPSIPS